MKNRPNSELLSIERGHKDISIFTNSSCSLNCKNCSVRYMLRADPHYQLSLEDVDKFIYYTKLSGYKFRILTIAGGEPLLWKNLFEGSRMLKEASIAKIFAMETNGITIENNIVNSLNTIVKLLDHVDRIRVSYYLENSDYIDSIRRAFPKTGDKFKGVFIENRINHKVVPMRRYPGTLPAPCRCPNYSVKGDIVYICAALSEMVAKFGWDWKDFTPYFERLKKGYLERMNKINKYTQWYCEYCLVNNKIWKQLKTEKH